MRTFDLTKYVLICLLCIVTVLCVSYLTPSTLSFFTRQSPMKTIIIEPGQLVDTSVDLVLDISSRTDVQTHSSWDAPIMWEGMFNAELYDQRHNEKGTSVALTVFAVGKYLDAYLSNFLNSSEYHFMVGLPVRYYVFTDHPEKVPALTLGPRRSLEIIKVRAHSRWQDISMMRMKTIATAVDGFIRRNITHVFCLDVDQVFTGRFGSEALGDSVALLHSWYYRRPMVSFTYDRNPWSSAFMVMGDFYYHAAVFGGSCAAVKDLAEACYQGILQDKKNHVEALWHDESHLNKYFWLHRPSKLLSPEYCWDPHITGREDDIHLRRLTWAPKKYTELRPNAW